MWIGNLPMSTELQKFHYLKEKYKMRQFNFLSKRHTKTLISKKTITILFRVGS